MPATAICIDDIAHWPLHSWSFGEMGGLFRYPALGLLLVWIVGLVVFLM